MDTTWTLHGHHLDNTETAFSQDLDNIWTAFKHGQDKGICNGTATKLQQTGMLNPDILYDNFYSRMAVMMERFGQRYMLD